MIADNSTLIYPTNITQATGFVATTVKSIADAYNSTGDMESSFAPHAADLAEISTALLGIADAWQAAGNELAKLWPNDFFTQNGPILAFGIGGAAMVVVLFIWWSMKKPSQ